MGSFHGVRSTGAVESAFAAGATVSIPAAVQSLAGVSEFDRLSIGPTLVDTAGQRSRAG